MIFLFWFALIHDALTLTMKTLFSCWIDFATFTKAASLYLPDGDWSMSQSPETKHTTVTRWLSSSHLLQVDWMGAPRHDATGTAAQLLSSPVSMGSVFSPCQQVVFNTRCLVYNTIFWRRDWQQRETTRGIYCRCSCVAGKVLSLGQLVARVVCRHVQWMFVGTTGMRWSWHVVAYF